MIRKSSIILGHVRKDWVRLDAVRSDKHTVKGKVRVKIKTGAWIRHDVS